MDIIIVKQKILVDDVSPVILETFTVECYELHKKLI